MHTVVLSCAGARKLQVGLRERIQRVVAQRGPEIVFRRGHRVNYPPTARLMGSCIGWRRSRTASVSASLPESRVRARATIARRHDQIKENHANLMAAFGQTSGTMRGACRAS